MNLNFHDIVRGAITSINEDTDGLVYISTGRTNVRGILTPTFTPVPAKLQVQAQRHTPINYAEGLERTNSLLTIYAYGNFSDIARPSGDGGSVINVSSGNRAGWYYITQVLEWWGENSPAWCAFEVTRQLNAAAIAQYVANIANGAVLS